MKKIISKKTFNLNNKTYIAGDEIITDDINIIRKLNERGYIEPLTVVDLTLIEREFKNKKQDEEEGNNDTGKYTKVEN